MARLARQKSEEAAFYHLLNRVAGAPTYYPFRGRRNTRKFLRLFEFYLRLYYCRMASFALIRNHYHSVIHFQQARQLSREELEERARLRSGRLWQLGTETSPQPSDLPKNNPSLFWSLPFPVTGIKSGKRTLGFHIFRHSAGSIIHERTGSLKPIENPFAAKVLPMCSE